MKIKRDGNQLTITKDGKKTVRRFVTPEQAIAAHEKLLAENERELAERRAAPRVDPRHPELEAQIASAPEDPAGYAVLGDWLESQADPRGRLIALQLARESIAHEVVANRKYFLGPLASFHKYDVFRWEHGFIHGVSLDGSEHADAADILEQLLQHPSGRFLVSVSIGSTVRSVDVQAALDLLARVAPQTLRSVHVIGSPHIDVQPMLAALPRLHSVTLVRTPCPPFDLPALKFLRIVGGPLPASVGVKLRQLDLVDVDGDELELISTLDVTELERLQVSETKDIGRLVRELPVLPQLTWLELFYNAMTDADAIELARRRERFPKLTYLAAFGNKLTPAGAAALAPLAPEVST